MDDFDLDIYFGKLFDKHYPRYYAKGEGSRSISYQRKMAFKYMWKIHPWLEREFPDEVIDRDSCFYRVGQHVLVLSLSVSDEYYFREGGKLAEVLKSGGMESLINRFIAEIDAKEKDAAITK
jgi:hypothetical protein